MADQLGNELSVLSGIGRTSCYVEVSERLKRAGWAPCGSGDWAFALRSPSGQYAARISPFDPAAPYTADLYRRGAATGQLPALADHVELAGGADLIVMEFLDPASRTDAVAARRAIESRAPGFVDLADLIARIHRQGRREQPWWGPLDLNPDNIRRGTDRRLVVADVYFADGPSLYATALENPDRIVRDYPAHRRRHMLEIPLAASGGWDPDVRARIATGLARAEARLTNSTA